MTIEQLQRIQQVPLDAARFCQDCKLIHNNGNECPKLHARLAGERGGADA